MIILDRFVVLFFFNDTPTTEIYTLSLHDALPICCSGRRSWPRSRTSTLATSPPTSRSEEHTSELQSLRHLVCRLLLEKKGPVLVPCPNSRRAVSPQSSRPSGARGGVPEASGRGLVPSPSSPRELSPQQFFFLIIRRPPKSPLFPSPTLFR